MIEYLEPVRPVSSPASSANPEHPMRRVTVEASVDPESWTEERRRDVGSRFSEMAPNWHANHDTQERYESIDDALERGGPMSGVVLELGAGTGLGTSRLAAALGPIIALDLSPEMIAQVSPGDASRVVGDGSQLPVRSDAVDLIVLVNMLLFPSEVDRVLRTGGAVMWVNTNSELTPIHLPPEAVDAALPGEWSGLASRAGTGTWSVLRRAAG